MRPPKRPAHQDDRGRSAPSASSYGWRSLWVDGWNGVSGHARRRRGSPSVGDKASIVTRRGLSDGPSRGFFSVLWWAGGRLSARKVTATVRARGRLSASGSRSYQQPSTTCLGERIEPSGSGAVVADGCAVGCDLGLATSTTGLPAGRRANLACRPPSAPTGRADGAGQRNHGNSPRGTGTDRHPGAASTHARRAEGARRRHRRVRAAVASHLRRAHHPGRTILFAVAGHVSLVAGDRRGTCVAESEAGPPGSGRHRPPSSAELDATVPSCCG